VEFLDGLRGLAILLVVFYHAYARWPEYVGFVEVTQVFFIFKYGNFGVQLFFMISGFVIFMSLDRSRTIGGFFFRRWIRLFPAMLVATIFIYFSAPYFHERPKGIPSSIDVIPGLLFLSPGLMSRVFGVDFQSLEGSFWSLYVEVIFYFVVGLFYFWLGRRRVLYSVFCVFLVSYIAELFFSDTSFGVFLSKTLIHLGFVYYGWFLIGMLVYLWFKSGRLSWGERVLFFLSVLMILMVDELGHLLASLVAIGVFLIPFFSLSARRLLSGRLLLFLGLVSYPLYLIHENIMISMVVKLLSIEYVATSPLLSFFVPLGPIFILVLMSWVITRNLEPLVRRKIVDVLRKIVDVLRFSG
jgi:peptidoglycan/LPS O-acetylase OafA/YrhL